MDKNIKYIVTIKDEHLHAFASTTINRQFCGEIIAQIRDHFVFSLNGSGAQVIIPYEWIECMAPSKAHWEQINEECVLGYRCTITKEDMLRRRGQNEFL